jgi:signal transduction histidine kinase
LIEHGVIEVRLDIVVLGSSGSGSGERAEAGTGVPRTGAPPDLPAGQYVRLSVIDNGTGIAPEVLDRIFEPFFTTKPPGEGSGLGLAAVHGIAVAHGGGAYAKSSVGHGTTVTLYLPTSTPVADTRGIAA